MADRRKIIVQFAQQANINMAFKFVIFAAVVAVAYASHNEYLAPVAVGSHSSVSTYSTHQQHAPSVHAYAAPAVHAYAAPAVHAYAAPAVHAYAAPAVHAYAAPAVHAYAHEPTAPANYDYGYGVSDPITGDHHSQQESRRGDAVQGSYSLIEADGSKRTVEYAADDHNGFNAVVHKEPAVTYAAHAPVVQAKLVAAPSYVSGYTAHSVAAPSLVHGYSVAAPSLFHGHSVAAPSLVHGHSVAAPSLVHGYAASPVYASGYSAHSVVAPSLVKGYAGVVPALAHNVW